MADGDVILADTDRGKLDGIVQQMQANKESDTNIQFVVNDFKQKYGKPAQVDNSQKKSPDQTSADGSTSSAGQQVQASQPSTQSGNGYQWANTSTTSQLAGGAENPQLSTERVERLSKIENDGQKINQDATTLANTMHDANQKLNLNLNYEPINKLRDLYYAQNNIDPKAKDAGKQAQDLRAQIDALRNAPVKAEDNKNFALNAQGLPDPMKVPLVQEYKNYGDMYDASVQHFKTLEEGKPQLAEQQAKLNAIKDEGHALRGYTGANMGYLHTIENSFTKSIDNILTGFASMSLDKDQKIDLYSKKMFLDQVMYPKNAPEGLAGTGAEAIGGVLPYVAAGAVGAGEALPGMLVTSLLMGAEGKGAGEYNSFAEAKQKGLNDGEAIDYAHKMGLEQGASGLALGALTPFMGAAGEKAFLDAGTKSVFKKFLAQQGVMAPAFGGSQIAQNVFANYISDNKVNRGPLDGFTEAMGTAIFLGMGFEALHSIPDLAKGTRDVFETALAPHLPQVQQVMDEAVKQGVVDNASRDRIMTGITEKSNALAMMPPDLTPEQKQTAMPYMTKVSDLMAQKAADLTGGFHSDIDRQIQEQFREMHEKLGTPLSIDERQTLNELQARSTEKGDDGKLKKPLTDVEKEEMKHLEGRQKSVDNKKPEPPASQEPIEDRVPPVKVGNVENDEHGVDTASDLGKMNGKKPTDLTPEGIEQAKALGSKYAAESPDIKTIYASPIERAQQTAHLAAEEAGKQLGRDIPVKTQMKLATWDVGKYDGLPETQFDESHYVNNPDKEVPEGESFNDFKDRAIKAWNWEQKLPPDVKALTHSKMQRMFDALNQTGGEWNDKAKEIYLKDERNQPDQVDNKPPIDTELSKTQEAKESAKAIEETEPKDEKPQLNKRVLDSDIKPQQENNLNLEGGYKVSAKPTQMPDGEDGMKVTLEKPNGDKVNMGNMYTEDVASEINKKLRGFELAAKKPTPKEKEPVKELSADTKISFDHAGTEYDGKIVKNQGKGIYRVEDEKGNQYSIKEKYITPKDTQLAAIGALPFAKEFIKEDIEPILKGIGRSIKSGYEFLQHALSPTTGVSEKAMDKISSALGDRNKAAAEIDGATQAMQKMFDKMPEQDRIDFIDRIKKGEKQPSPELQNIADLLKGLDKQLYDEITKYKPSLNWKDNHFRVLWKTIPGSLEEKSGFFGKRPLQGSKGFMKQATLTDMSEGIAKGGVPTTTNPIAMFKLAYSDGMKYITAQRMWQGLKDDGFAKFVKGNQRPPEGYVKLNDRIANVYFPTEKGLVNTGNYYIEEGAARVLNNYLSENNKFLQTDLAKGLMEVKNIYTQAELSLSAFHAVAESLEASGSQIGLGLRKMINLKDFVGGGKDIITSPAAAKTAFSLGRNVQKLIGNAAEFKASDMGKEFLKKMPDAEQYIDDFFHGGGKLKQSDEYRIKSLDALKEHAGKDNYIGAALRAIPAFNEMILNPLFNHVIPAMKVGMFFKEFPVALQENQQRIDNGNITRGEVARQTINFIDDRLGEMNFDNLFWDKSMKTAAQLMFRSVTWKLGNIRAMGGAIPEQAMEMVHAYKENRAPILMPKAAWAFGLAAMATVIGSTIQYLATGKKPEGIKDIIAPQIDKNDPNQRVVVPTYLKDAMHFTHDPLGYFKTSASGPFSKMMDIWSNKDFYGYEIHDPTDTKGEQAKQIAEYFIPKPFSFTSAKQQIDKGESAGRVALSFLGFQQAPGYLTHSSIENKIFDLYNLRNSGTKPYKEKEANDTKREIRGLLTSGKVDEAQKKADEAVKSGLLKPKQVRLLMHEAEKSGSGNASDYFFKVLPKEDKIALFKEMSDEEKKRFDPKGKVAKLVDEEKP